MSIDGQVRRAVHQVAERVAVPQVDLDAVRSRARRRRTVSTALVAAAVAIVVVGTFAATAVLGDRDVDGPLPADRDDRPGLVVGDVPVWYDAAGLHRGDVVEQTAVQLFSDAEGGGVLALVRGGALYRDPATSDVWFHPWGRDPRIVGRDSAAGPGGDPESRVGAWFEDRELVVYDTLTGRELSRTTEDRVNDWAQREHADDGNGFLHVSPEEVVWRSGNRVHRLDVGTGISSVVDESRSGGANPWIADVHEATTVRAVRTEEDSGDSALLIETTQQEPLRPEGALEPIGRLSPDGSFVLAPTSSNDSHGASVVAVTSGETWDLPFGDFYAWISWSYGDVAVVQIDREDEESILVACDPVARSCDQLPTDGPVLLPTS